MKTGSLVLAVSNKDSGFSEEKAAFYEFWLNKGKFSKNFLIRRMNGRKIFPHLGSERSLIFLVVDCIFQIP